VYPAFTLLSRVHSVYDLAAVDLHSRPEPFLKTHRQVWIGGSLLLG
jgi:hypothetical protein